MGTTKAKWKRAPKDQRRVASDRTIPNARFARGQRRSRSLPRALPRSLSHQSSDRRPLLPLLLGGGLVTLVIAVIVLAVIAIGTVAQAKQRYDKTSWQANYYGLPTQPFSTPDWTQIAPDSQFADLASPDDPRWTPSVLTPLAGSIDLRTIPTGDNNQPIQTLSARTDADVILDPSWGAWAQVKLGDIIGWIDTSTVRIEAAS